MQWRWSHFVSPSKKKQHGKKFALLVHLLEVCTYLVGQWLTLWTLGSHLPPSNGCRKQSGVHHPALEGEVREVIQLLPTLKWRHECIHVMFCTGFGVDFLKKTTTRMQVIRTHNWKHLSRLAMASAGGLLHHPWFVHPRRHWWDNQGVLLPLRLHVMPVVPWWWRNDVFVSSSCWYTTVMFVAEVGRILQLQKEHKIQSWIFSNWAHRAVFHSESRGWHRLSTKRGLPWDMGFAPVNTLMVPHIKITSKM